MVSKEFNSIYNKIICFFGHILASALRALVKDSKLEMIDEIKVEKLFFVVSMYSIYNFQGKVSILNALTNVLRELVSISLVFNTSSEKGGCQR